MRIAISVKIHDLRQWLLPLRAALEAQGHQVTFRLVSGGEADEAGSLWRKRIETLVFGRGKGLWQPLPAQALAPAMDDRAVDLVLTLSREGHERSDLALFLDGEPGIGGLDAILLRRFIPYLEIRDGQGKVLEEALPALDEQDVLVRALDAYYARCITLVRRAIARHGQVSRAPGMGRGSGQPRLEAPPSLARTILGRIARRLTPPRIDHWRVGIRLRRPALNFAQDALIEGFTWLEDDGTRYYADPMLFEHEGRHFLFVEEYPFATRRGLISCCELAPDGQALHPPIPILSGDSHFSYPFLFRHGGEIYLMPENAAANRLPLYRASGFPFRWEWERDLLPGRALHDATLFEEAGTFWLMGMSQDDGGSSWDCLSLYRAASPLGPFEAVPNNPILMDARYARPAGPVLMVDGAPLRPVQSCLGGYGRFIRFLSIDAIGEMGLVQAERGRLLAPRESDILGVHTYSRDSRFEVIDACSAQRLHGGWLGRISR